MGEAKTKEPWKPGFATVQEALEAGQEFYAKTNGAKGRFQRDFHIVANEHSRFHFADGPRPALAQDTSDV